MAAPRDVVRRVRANREKTAGNRERILPARFTQKAAEAHKHYADDVAAGILPMPEKGSMEARGLARLAALANVGKADPKYLAFKEFWYHERKK